MAAGPAERREPETIPLILTQRASVGSTDTSASLAARVGLGEAGGQRDGNERFVGARQPRTGEIEAHVTAGVAGRASEMAVKLAPELPRVDSDRLRDLSLSRRGGERQGVQGGSTRSSRPRAMAFAPPPGSKWFIRQETGHRMGLSAGGDALCLPRCFCAS